MSIGYATIHKIRQLEKNAKLMGFRLDFAKARRDDMMAVYPDQDALPIYTRDAELFIGDLAEVETWLRGVSWMKNYLVMLTLVNDKKILKKEQDIRNQQLVDALKR